MLIRIIKVTMWTVFKFTTWIGLPFWKLLYRLTWRGTPQEFVIALTEDPDIVRKATETGMAGILKMYQQKCMAIADAPKPPTQEDRDWAEFIQNYGENPQPDMVPEYFRYVIRGGTTGSTELSTAGALVALCQRHKDEWEKWQKVPEFLRLFKDALEWQHADSSRPGWNDFYMVQWFIMRTDSLAAIIAERTKLPGMVGSTCTWMADSVAQQIPAFREALERVGYEFQAPDFKAAVEAERRYPMSIEACNEFLQTLAGATITRAEMMLTGDDEASEREHVEIITNAGMFCIVAPDLGFSWTKEKERKC